MNYKKILLSIFAIVWVIGVIIQQIYWISIESYSSMAFIVAIIELIFPYIIFKAMED